jgi:hypothetical protein
LRNSFSAHEQINIFILFEHKMSKQTIRKITSVLGATLAIACVTVAPISANAVTAEEILEILRKKGLISDEEYPPRCGLYDGHHSRRGGAVGTHGGTRHSVLSAFVFQW